MRPVILAVALAVSLGSASLRAQRGHESRPRPDVTSTALRATIPVTVTQAEAEALSFPRADPTSLVQAKLADSAFAGTPDRRCVAASSVQDVRATGSVRSGEILVRGLPGEATLAAGNEHKILWLPLHGSRELRGPLVLRAVRIDQPTDSLRLTIAHAVYGGGARGVYGYPSLVSFPAAGRWLVVATADSDWGCFVLDVSKSSGNTR